MREYSSDVAMSLVNEAVETSGSVPMFDVREFARTAAGSHREELNLEAFRARPLAETTLDTLRYLRDLERATMQHLRTVLVTPTHKDARVTAFLTTWAFEKYWIADALTAILDAHPEAATAIGADRLRARTLEASDRFAPIRESIVANWIGDDVVAVHTTAGTVDEWLTQAAYSRLTELDPHPELDVVIERMLRLKHRHLVFFESQSRMRLARSDRARTLARRRLARSSWPVGAGRLPREATARFFAGIVDSEPGLARRLDARVDELPGQQGLALVERASEKAQRQGEPAADRLGHRIGAGAATIAKRLRR